MKTTKKLLSLAFAILILCISIVPVYAVDAPTPRFNNTATTESTFVIYDDGLAGVCAMYIGYDNITTFACIQIKIERKVLFWWSDVENGWTDNTYVTELWGVENAVEYFLQLEKKGTYRAIVTYTINGLGGDSDIITSVLEYDYE